MKTLVFLNFFYVIIFQFYVVVIVGSYETNMCGSG